jgi:decaprenylphospho-beta-D-erythro-pentofuranosid-2-ulose 2-reductase
MQEDDPFQLSPPEKDQLGARIQRLQTRREPQEPQSSGIRPAATLPSDRPAPAAGPAGPRRVLILGATSGIAEACARIWAAQGASLFLVARNPEKLAAVAADLKTRGAMYVDTAVADLDETDKHPALLAHAINSLTGLDVAFFAHGVLGDQSTAERDFEAAAQILHTNLISAVSLLTWLANFCVQRHAGTLAVLSSVAGDRGRKSNYVYGASKAGLTAFLEGLRNRVDREGVTVLTIKPGPIKTAMTANMPNSAKFADVDETAKTIVKAVDAKKDTLYVPFQWAPIMWVIRHVPERIFKKLNL